MQVASLRVVCALHTYLSLSILHQHLLLTSMHHHSFVLLPVAWLPPPLPPPHPLLIASGFRPVSKPFCKALFVHVCKVLKPILLRSDFWVCTECGNVAGADAGAASAESEHSIHSAHSSCCCSCITTPPLHSAQHPFPVIQPVASPLPTGVQGLMSTGATRLRQRVCSVRTQDRHAPVTDAYASAPLLSSTHHIPAHYALSTHAAPTPPTSSPFAAFCPAHASDAPASSLTTPAPPPLLDPHTPCYPVSLHTYTLISTWSDIPARLCKLELI